MRIYFFAVGIFSSFDVRFTRGKTDPQPHHENLRKIQKIQKSEKNENNY